MNLPPVEPDAPASNVVGETTSITLFTTQRPWGRFVMAPLFAISRAVPKALEAMDRLSFISFASWTLIRELPYNGTPQSLRRLRYVVPIVSRLTGYLDPQWGEGDPPWILPKVVTAYC